MSENDAIRRTAEGNQDFYQTLPCQIRCLCSFLDLNGNTVLDAGSGKKVIANQIEQSFPKSIVLTSEKNFMGTSENESLEFNFDDSNRTVDNGLFPVPNYGDFLEMNPSWDNFDYIISNPPYSLKNEFVEHALKLSNNVFMIFPLQVLNYIEFCENWMDNPLYCGKILMYPKVILNAEGNYIQGGNTGYGWFHWSNEKSTKKTSEKYEFIEDIRKYI